MNDSTAIYNAIEEIAATPSKNTKQALVAKYGQDATFQRVLIAALNPFITYGIAKIPHRTKPIFGGSDVDNDFDEYTWTLLDNLAKRELTGNAARDMVKAELERLNEQSAELLTRIIIKDLRAGFGDSTVNKAMKGFLPEFPYMRCCLPKNTKLENFDWVMGVVSQEKADGMFANVNHEDTGLVFMTTRQGTPFPMEPFASMVAEIQQCTTPGTQTHGELLVKKNGVIMPRAEGNGLLNSILDGGSFAEDEVPIYMMWDSIPLSAVVPKGRYEVEYINRLRTLVEALKKAPGIKQVALIETRIVRSLADAYAHCSEMLKKGKEGTIIKNPHGHWRDGTSKDQVKLKLEFDVDLEITAVVGGKENGKNKGRPGSLTCVSSDRLLVVDVTVKDEAMRDSIEAFPEDWIGRILPVTANEITEPSESNPLHSLFLPRALENKYRKDKSTADSLPRIFEIKQAAIDATSVGLSK